jgi:hypothetical protein
MRLVDEINETVDKLNEEHNNPERTLKDLG